MSLPTLPTASLFDLYKSEKADFADELTEFPTFRVWEETYSTERDEEMASMDVGEMYTMDDEPIYEELDSPTPHQPKTVTEPKPTPTPSTKGKKLTNMDRARTIFSNMVGPDNALPTRGDVIARFMSELGVSKACSSTYHHNIKQKYA